MRTLWVAVVLLGGTASAAPPKPKPKPRPTSALTFGTPTVTGALDAKAVATVVRRSTAKLLSCYNMARVKAPDLEGTVTVTFTIGADGKVAGAVGTGLDEVALTCITATFTKIKFARRKDGAPVEVTYPLTYETSVTHGAFAALTGTGDLGSNFNDQDIYGGLLGNEVGEMTGGFGVRGGGGTGWGTIGTGRYGTIGKGSGSGSGYGVGGMRGRTDVPNAKIGNPAVSGDLDKAIIRRYIKRNLQKLQYCYEKELLAKPKLRGTVTVEFTIGNDGKVTTSAASGLRNTAVESCVARAIKAIEFPKPKGSGQVIVKYPFTFSPGEPSPPAAKK